MSREGDRRRAHIVAAGTGQDMRCVVMAESALCNSSFGDFNEGVKKTSEIFLSPLA